MATFVDLLPEKELGNILTEFIVRLQNKSAGKTAQDEEVTKTAASLTGGKEPADLLRFFLTQVPLLFKEASDKEVENFFFAVFNLIKKLDHESGKKVIEEAVDQLVTTQPLQDKSSTRIKILVHVYNIFDENPTARGGYFLSLLEYSNRSHHAEVLLPQFKDIDRRIVEWGLSRKEKQRLYKHIRNTYRNAARGKEAYDWSVRYLSLFDSESEITNDDLEEAYNACVEAIRIPNVYRYDDLAQLLPIKKLQGHSNELYNKSHQLLTIYLQEDVKSLLQFINNNPEVLKQLVLEGDAITEKIRLLSIASIGASVSAQSGQVGYGTIATKLDVEEGEVEYYVVLSITQGVIDAKIDQLTRTVTITRSLQRTFSTEEWKQLSQHLSVWTNNVKLLLKTLNECKQQGPQV